MKIGITYDLRSEYIGMGFSEEETAEFDSDETIQAIQDTVRDLGHDAVRIGNLYELVKRLAGGERWDLVFNIAEGLYGRSREAQVPAVLEAFNISYTFSDPLTLSLSLDKAMAKCIVQSAGVPTPDFFVISSESDLNTEGEDRAVFPLFVKPLSEGTGKGISPDSIIRNPEMLRRQCKRLMARYNQPVIVERYLPGREFTVGIVGTGKHARVLGIMEVKLLKNAEPGVYSFLNKELCEERVKYLPVHDKKILREAANVSLNAYDALGCRDAGRVDLRADKNGKLYFLEVNPLAGLHPNHSDLPILCGIAGISYKDLIAGIINSASGRIKSDKEYRPSCPGIHSLN